MHSSNFEDLTFQQNIGVKLCPSNNLIDIVKRTKNNPWLHK